MLNDIYKSFVNAQYIYPYTGCPRKLVTLLTLLLLVLI